MNIFFTLTYDELNLPIVWDKTDPDSFPLPSVSKKDVQKFIKRVRRRLEYLGYQSVRYVVTSEYGPRTYRPHYHGILFGFPDGVDPVRFIQGCWKLGMISAEPLRDGGCAYCSKYLFKSSDDELRFYTPNFLLASRRPPLGDKFFTEKQKEFFKEHLQTWFYSLSGKRIALPRRVRDDIFDANDKALIHEKNIERFNAWYSQFLSKYPDSPIGRGRAASDFQALVKQKNFDLNRIIFNSRNKSNKL